MAKLFQTYIEFRDCRGNFGKMFCQNCSHDRELHIPKWALKNELGGSTTSNILKNSSGERIVEWSGCAEEKCNCDCFNIDELQDFIHNVRLKNAS